MSTVRLTTDQAKSLESDLREVGERLENWSGCTIPPAVASKLAEAVDVINEALEAADLPMLHEDPEG